MRGGLGRVLLTALMLLAIVPLGVVSYLAINRVQGDLRQAAMDNLDLVAASKAAVLEFWLDSQRHSLALLASFPDFQQAVQHQVWPDACRALAKVRSIEPDLVSVALLPASEQVALCVTGDPIPSDASRSLLLTFPLKGGDGRTAAVLVGYPDLQVLDRVLDPTPSHVDGRVLLVDRDGKPLLLSPPHSGDWPEERLHGWAVDEAIKGGAGSGLYKDAFGNPVVGAYRWLADWQIALLVERPREAALAREDDLAAMLVGSTLAVALLTTMLAAVITRQLTRPIVRLTMSAVKIASGDLEQRVEVNRRDEIGILAQAFNIMTAELGSLYESLEQKVAERTSQLMEANRQLRYQAMQLKLSAEIGRVATSILDIDVLLKRVTELVLDSYGRVFYVYHVAVLLRDEFEEWVETQASSRTEGIDAASRVRVGGDTPVGQTAADGLLRTQELGQEAIQIVVPLRIGARVIGVLDLYCSRREALSEVDIDVLRSLGDQISVAMQNARIYAAERETVERLSRLEHMRSASLDVGSRELATELNTIIGFSRLMLKGVDGPLTDVQRGDLVVIYKSGYRLLGLIDNVITLAELESGTVSLDLQPVDLGALVDEVLATIRQRLVEVTAEWAREDGMSSVLGDAGLLRKSLLSLLVAVAEQAPEGKVVVDAWAPEVDTAYVMLTVGGGNGSNGRPRAHTVPSSLTSGVDAVATGRDAEDMSVGLALAKQVITLHRGWMQLTFDPELGLTGVVALPVER